jgi:ABC-type branched-subunit amino acid transport system substrate-binding protein
MDKSVDGRSEYFYTMGHTVGGEADAMRTFFTKNPAVRTIAILCWNDAWGKAHSAQLRAIAAEVGVVVVGEECTNDFGSNYRTEMSKIKSMRADAIFLTASYPEVPLKARSDLGVTVPVLTLYVVDAIETRDMPRTLARDVWVIDWVPGGEFAKKFQAKYGVYPILEAQNHYDTVYAIAHALEESPDDISSGLKSVKFEGVDGTIDFTRGDNIRVNTSNAKLYRVDPVSGYPEVK